MATSPRPITIVTGGSRGIGAATAVHLAGLGHDVVVAYRSGRVEALGVVEAAVARGVRALAVRADVSDPDDVEEMFAGRARRSSAPRGAPGTAVPLA